MMRGARIEFPKMPMPSEVIRVRGANAYGSEDEQGGRWPYAGTAGQLKELGANHVATGLDGVVVDEAHGLVTAPAYMCNAAPHEVFDSVGRMVEATLALARK